MGPKLKKIHPTSVLLSDPREFTKQHLRCLDQTHLFLRGEREVQLSPTEYALSKLLLIGSQVSTFVPISTMVMCFHILTNPTCLKDVNHTHWPRQEEFATSSHLDLLLFAHTLQLLPDLEISPAWKQQLFSLVCQDDTSQHLDNGQQVYQDVLKFKQGITADCRKRISKHISGANAKFKEYGLGIEIFSVGQNKGYMAGFISNAGMIRSAG